MATREMAKLRMGGVAGVRRAANRAQLGGDDELVDGWAVMKQDGTPAALPASAELLEYVARTEAAVVSAHARIVELERTPWERIERAAEVLRAEDATLTRERAIDRVVVEQPELKAAYYGEPVRKASADPAPRVVSASAAWQAIEKAADEVRAKEPTLTKEQSVDRVVVEEPELVRAYRAAR